MKHIMRGLVAVGMGSLTLLGCGRGSPEPKTPEARVAEDEAELEDTPPGPDLI